MARRGVRRAAALAAVTLGLATAWLAGAARAAPPPPAPIAIKDIVLTTSDGRAVPVHLRAPGRTRRAGLLIFSHGANSNAVKYDALTGAWARAGWVVAAPVHADSPDHPGGGKVPQEDSLRLRLQDMRLLLDSIPALETAAHLRIDPRHIAATGHSYGALVAQVLGGAVVTRPGDGGPVPDPRIRAVVAFSPPGPIPGYVEASGWAKMTVPQIVVTGDADVLPMIAPAWTAHRVSFDAAHVSPSVLVVGAGVDHYFGNIIGRPERVAPDQRAAFDAAVAASQDFLAATVGGDPGALKRLRALSAGGAVALVEVR